MLIPFVDRQAIINVTNHAPMVTINQTQAQNGLDNIIYEDTNFDIDDNSILIINSDGDPEPILE